MKRLTLGVVALLFLFVMGAIFIQQFTAPFQQANVELRTQVSNFLNPTPTIIPDTITILHEVTSLARLETIQFSVEKVITADSGQDTLRPLFGDRLLFVAHGNVIAGVDLNKMAKNDIVYEAGVLKVMMPEPEIFSANLDNEKSYVFDRQTGIFVQGDPNLETLARQAAEREIYQAALSDGIIDQARTNAENYLTRLLGGLGFPQVVFIRPTPTPVPTASPTTQPPAATPSLAPVTATP